jgi:hypothetical protein
MGITCWGRFLRFLHQFHVNTSVTVKGIVRKGYSQKLFATETDLLESLKSKNDMLNIDFEELDFVTVDANL